MNVDFDDLIGRTHTYVSPERIGAASARYYEIATSEEGIATSHAGGHMYAARGLVPPTLIFDTNQFTTLPADVDGFSGHQWVKSDRFSMVRGGNAYEWFRDIRVDDVITIVWRLRSAEPVVGKSGRDMWRLTSIAEYTDVAGETVARQEETMFLVEKSASE